MNLHDLMNGFANKTILHSLPCTFVRGITDTSKNVQPGFLFVAIKGYKADGHSYIPDAIEKGAIAIVGEDDIPSLSVPYIRVNNSRQILGRLAKRFYKHPSSRKTVIGITGTNGKTTISYLLKHIFEQNGLSCALMGTIKNVINQKELSSFNTTPNVLVVNELLVQSQDDVVIMEISSHGLAQYRLEGIQFDCCVFTNLSRDHLDYHGSMDQYFQAKAELFNKMKDHGTAVINIGDSWGEKLSAGLRKRGSRVCSVGAAPYADIRLEELLPQRAKVKVVDQQRKQTNIQFTMAGTHNLYNAVLTFAAARQLKLTNEQILPAIQKFSGVSGRFERLACKQGVTVIVDYAHTADGIFHCLRTAKQCGAKRIIHVFGFRGNRDEGKREEMIRVSAEWSDKYILTLDDLNSVPHNEMVESLVLLNGQAGRRHGMVIPDRTEAIRYALDQSSEGDWIIVTGKGHEKYQQSYSLPTVCDKDTIMYLKDWKGRRQF